MNNVFVTPPSTHMHNGLSSIVIICSGLLLSNLCTFIINSELENLHVTRGSSQFEPYLSIHMRHFNFQKITNIYVQLSRVDAAPTPRRSIPGYSFNPFHSHKCPYGNKMTLNFYISHYRKLVVILTKWGKNYSG